MDSSLLRKPKPRGRPAKFTKDQVQEMKRLNDDGFTMESIGRAYGVSQPAIFKNLKKLREGGFDK